ncbi:flagellin [Acidovorax sp. CCYZU-2555]|uniref:flagellin N-terminal helical domain-containing protein n=1 Tax=Acidovorax sp. CCYZU-2555 TaxID=2835042 RepID=UPI001BCF728F|nr:flagellin [Acidovorax sp. CCYZU-2555]MBS7781190.1 flagellin [Acidovorax sp. CCYZU-2555]
MAMTINTNVASINAQRNLSLSGSSLSTSMQRLSSGLRVNSAKDDAAGLAISERMNAQTKGLTVAARNANDGISLAQTAEGALGKVGDMLQRVRELAVQSSNATNSESDRKAMQSEVTQLVSEIDRVAKTTEFNGKKLLDGSFSGAMFQVGANAGNNITLGSLSNASAKGLSNISYATNSEVVTQATVATLDAHDGTDLSIAINGATAIELGPLAAASSAEERMGQVVAAINAKTADTGVTAFLTQDPSTKDFTVEIMSENVKDDGSAQSVEFGAGFGAATTGLTAAANIAADNTDNANSKGIDGIDVTSQSAAWKALKQVDSAMDQVNSARGDLGALQTRFEKTVENIDIQNENISAAKGRITDADFAVETASLSKAQILQQAGTAMVAQANQLPQNVLSLLR